MKKKAWRKACKKLEKLAELYLRQRNEGNTRIAELEHELEVAQRQIEILRGKVPYQPDYTEPIKYPEPYTIPWPGPRWVEPEPARTYPDWEPYGRWIITCGS